MKLLYFIKAFCKESLITITVGAVTFALILSLTLNLGAALLALLFIAAIAIFQNSFSRGWLFLFAGLVLIPSSKIGTSPVSIHEILLSILALVGLAHIVAKDAKIKPNRLYFYFFLLILVGASIMIFSHAFHLQINPDVALLTILLVLMSIILMTFQHFFQTKKRIRRFFILLVAVGLAHSLFGIISLLFGWQSSTGLGITRGIFQLFSDNLIARQINGFLGNGYLLGVGENALAPFLLISIQLTLGLALVSKKPAEKTAVVQPASFRLFDSIYTVPQKKYWLDLWENSSRASLFNRIKKIFVPKVLVVLALFVQITALILTFSYSSIVIFGIGLFVCAVLLRSKAFLTISMAVLVIFALVIPSMLPSATVQSKHDIARWSAGFKQVGANWIWGSGWRLEKTDPAGNSLRVYNSYLKAWNTFGLIGLLVLMGMLAQYFKDLRKSYLTSDGPERIWLIVIIAIFIEFLFLAATDNSLFFGPAAIVFWLLYAVGFNLRRKTVVFGLTETRLHI